MKLYGVQVGKPGIAQDTLFDSGRPVHLIFGGNGDGLLISFSLHLFPPHETRTEYIDAPGFAHPGQYLGMPDFTFAEAEVHNTPFAGIPALYTSGNSAFFPPTGEVASPYGLQVKTFYREQQFQFAVKTGVLLHPGNRANGVCRMRGHCAETGLS